MQYRQQQQLQQQQQYQMQQYQMRQHQMQPPIQQVPSMNMMGYQQHHHHHNSSQFVGWMDHYDTREWDDDDAGVDSTWAGGAGFDMSNAVQKWKGTRKICLCWPLYSESVTLTPNEVHVKRNECPALPRECRPYRSWAVAPLEKISAFRMSKETFKPIPIFLLFAFSVAVGFAIARIIQFAVVEYNPQSGTVISVTGSVDFIVAGVIMIVVCCLGFQIINLCTPLRLQVSVDGTHDWFAIDLIPGSVQPDEIKKAINSAVISNGSTV